MTSHQQSDNLERAGELLPPSSDTAPAPSVGHVPEELVREIMKLTMQGHVGDLDPTQPPLAFLKVCRTWKTIAESIPSLWSGIAITPPHFLRANLPVVKKWLRRSGSTRLQVGIYAPLTIRPALLNEMIAVFLPTSHRWECLNLGIPVHSLQVLLNAPLPSLETLIVSLNIQPIIAVSPTATRLRNVHLSVYPPLITPDGGLLYLGWNHITHLVITSVAGTIEDIWNIFPRCPCLVSLNVMASNNHATPFIPYFPHRPFYSNRLTQLIVSTNSRPGVIGYFLDGLYLPALQDLQLRFTDRVYDTHAWPRAAILDLRRRALPLLSMLCVRGKTIAEEDLCGFVLEMKYLERLDVNDGTNDLVTQAVLNLLPQDEAAVRRQREAHRQELRFHDRI